MKHLTIHYLHLKPLFKYGFSIGLVSSFAPSLVFVFILWKAAKSITEWLDAASYRLPIAGLPIEIRSVDLLGLAEKVEWIQMLASWSWLMILLIIVGVTLAQACFSGLVTVLAGLVFNLLTLMSGGLQITVLDESSSVVPQIAEPVSPPPSATHRPRLEISEPIRRVIFIEQDVTLLGSDLACQVRLDGLPPRQAQISLEDGRYILRDFGQGQTMVQNQIVRGPHMLKDGFVLRMGVYTISFRQ